MALLTSCESKKGGNTLEKHLAEETPEALQNNKVSSSFRTSSNLVEQLYEEIARNNPHLQKFQENLDEYHVSKRNALSEVEQYFEKSTKYYASAKNLASSISDSSLQQRIKQLISISQKKNTANNHSLNAILQEIKSNNTSINEKHKALKIVLTLPLIEDYQNIHSPEGKSLKILIKQQDQIIQSINSLTPKN